MKKLIIFLFVLFSVFSVSATKQPLSTSAYNEESITEDELQQEVDNQLSDLDFSTIEDVFQSIGGENSSLFNTSSFFEKIQQLLAGQFDSGQSLFQNLIEVFLSSLLDLLPIISLIVAISLLGNMIQGLKPSSNKSISNIVHFDTYGIVVTLVLTVVIKMINLSSSTVISLQGQMNAIFPILLTLLTAVGGTTSAGIYQPAMALLTNGILNLFTYLLLPLFIFSVVFSVISNLSNTIKFDKFASFFNSCFKWIIGFVFTIFSAFMTLQGITAGSIDGISIRTAKYAIRSYVPIVGSYISDGMGLILASSNLIKNAVGMGGLLMMLSSILAPLIEIVLFMLALKLIAGIIQPLGNKQVADFVSSLSKSMVLLIVLLVGVAFVYFILLGLVMCSANIV